MKAIMYGAGNIGRGFIAERFYLSGYETVFIDVNTQMVDAINEAGKYPIYVTMGTEYVPTWVENVRAVNGRDEAAAVAEIADADIMATALGANVLPFVAPLIAKAIGARRVAGGKPLNIFICENLIGSDKFLHDLVAPHIADEDKAYFDESIGFVSVVVGRTVPPTPAEFTEKYPAAVCADVYSELPANPAGLRPIGGEMPPVKGLVVFTPFEYYIERKLLIHNMGHAMTAYLASLKGYQYIHEGTDDAEIKYFTMRALIESARALAKRHGAPTDETIRFAEELVPRYENRLLMDSLDRVGRDPKRKVAAADRLGGAFKMVREQGGTPAYIAIGIAAAYLFRNESDPSSIELTDYVKENGIVAALAKYSDITDAADAAMVETFYNMLARKAPFAEFLPVLAEYLRTEH